MPPPAAVASPWALHYLGDPTCFRINGPNYSGLRASRWHKGPQVGWFVWTPHLKDILGGCAIYCEATVTTGSETAPGPSLDIYIYMCVEIYIYMYYKQFLSSPIFMTNRLILWTQNLNIYCTYARTCCRGVFFLLVQCFLAVKKGLL